MNQYIEIAKHILREETLRYIFFGVMVFILYHTLIRKYVKSAIQEITTFSSKMDNIDQLKDISKTLADLSESNKLIVSTLNGMVYDELAREVLNAKKINGRTHIQDEKFKSKWAKYVGLGDGNGDGLLNDWEDIPWITEDEYYEKIKL
jgi:hypothetical protein